MTLTFLENAALPPLAWLVSVDTGKCVVEHGTLVETQSGFFVEGIWSGEFADGGFDACESFFGSGAVERNGGLVLVPSSATVDYLYYRAKPDHFVGSNSLPLLLCALDDRLDTAAENIARINDTIMDGIDRHVRDLPTLRGGVRRLMHHNLVVHRGKVWEERKPLPPGFATFKSYRDYLTEILRGMIRNARSSARRTLLQVLTTQSTGYDSTAINALAYEYGIDLALSVAEPKETLGYYRAGAPRVDSDSGADICRILGLDMAPIDRRFFERGRVTGKEDG